MTNSNKGKRYSEEFKQQMYELNQNGSPVYKLSTEYGIPTGAIYKWFSELKPIGQAAEILGISIDKFYRVKKKLQK